jgi:hypothetical protein
MGKGYVFLQRICYNICMGFVEVTNKEYGKPLVILSELCFMAYAGMYLPIFTLYENGQILYRRNIDYFNVEYFKVILNNDEKNNFIKSLPFESIYKINEKTIDASEGCTDQTMTILELNIKEYKKVRVEGSVDSKYVPQDYITIYNSLVNYENEKAYKYFPNEDKYPNIDYDESAWDED